MPFQWHIEKLAQTNVCLGPKPINVESGGAAAREHLGERPPAKREVLGMFGHDTPTRALPLRSEPLFADMSGRASRPLVCGSDPAKRSFRALMRCRASRA